MRVEGKDLDFQVKGHERVKNGGLIHELRSEELAISVSSIIGEPIDLDV
jgi:hypothetical protein